MSTWDSEQRVRDAAAAHKNIQRLKVVLEGNWVNIELLWIHRSFPWGKLAIRWVNWSFSSPSSLLMKPASCTGSHSLYNPWSLSVNTTVQGENTLPHFTTCCPQSWARTLLPFRACHLKNPVPNGSRDVDVQSCGIHLHMTHEVHKTMVIRASTCPAEKSTVLRVKDLSQMNLDWLAPSKCRTERHEGAI